MKLFTSMVTAALYAMLIQNLVFGAAYSVSESIRIARRPKHFIMYATSVLLFSCFSSVGCWYVGRLELFASLSSVGQFVVYTVLLSLIFTAVGLFCLLVLKADKNFMSSLGTSAFNSLVLAVPVINQKANHDLFSSLAAGIGAAFAFVLAVVLINAGIRFIANNKAVPKIFRGTPALLIYVALVSMAFSCLSSGKAFFV